MILKEIKDIQEFSSKAAKGCGVFASAKWLGLYGSSLRMVGIFRDEKQMIGGFYFLKAKKFGLDFIKLPPYSPHCCLFFESESKNQSSRNNFSKELMEDICNYVSSQKASISILAFPPGVMDLHHFTWSGYKVIPNYTYQINLSKETEHIKGNFDPKHRNAINKAVKEGVEIKWNGVSAEEKFNFFRLSLKEAGANVYEAELKKILTEFSDHSNSFTVTAHLNGQLLGMSHCIYDETSCYYLLGGVNKGVVQGVNHLLVWNCIEKAKTLGCGIFDFEGSMLKGVEKFFRGFGPELIPYYTVNRANVLIELLLKFYKRSVF